MISKLLSFLADLGDVCFLDEEHCRHREDRVREACDKNRLYHVNDHAPITNRDLLSISDFV